MTTPLKPWENEAARSRVLNSSAPLPPVLTTTGMNRPRVVGPPILPPRPRNLSYNGAQSYGSGMYGRQMGYNSYTPYSSYPSSIGGYGGGYGYGGYGGMYGSGGMYGNSGYGYGMGPESRFIQLAEASTRPAFQGIESLVHAFSSISMMLDSTYFAVTSSFRAVLGVAENFGRIRSMFGQLWQSFALIRALNWLYKKVLSLLGYKVTNDMGKEAWNQALNETTSEVTQNVSSWPIFMFLGMIVSAPYIISKLLPPVIDNRDPKNWPANCNYLPVAYEYIASTPEELTIRPGDQVRIAPKSVQDEMQLGQSGWLYAASNRGAGIIPAAYLQLTNKPSIFNPTGIVNPAIPGPSTGVLTIGDVFMTNPPPEALNKSQLNHTTKK